MDEERTEATIPLGPFDLLGVVGAGGMGTVWKGVHRAEGLPVAVKVVTGIVATEPEYVRQFQGEARAMAGLNHPAIITVLDYGRVDAVAETASGGQLVAGSAYLAMEYASGGTLEDLGAPLSWGTLRAILLAVLDALAHAHARGVVHRDLKPSNVLVATTADGRPGLRLTDFGLARARALGEDPGAPRVIDTRDGMAGTPSYMSPEQLLERHRDLGPWTDLYALGVMAWQLATGRLPFRGRTFFMLAQAHLEGNLPPMNPPPDYAPGFEAWVRRLLEKSPHRRFRRAVDAAWALTHLEAPVGRAPLHAAPATSPLAWERLQELLERDKGQRAAFDPGDAPVLAWIDLPGQPSNVTSSLRWSVEVTLEHEHAAVDFDDDASFKPTSHGLPTIVRVVRPDGSVDFVPGEDAQPGYDDFLPPMPTTWRVAEPAQRSTRLTGAGLGLFGLRRPGLVDRDDERNQLWDLLREVRATRSTRLAIIRGPSGVGKSALAEWLAHRAHEVGSAIVLHGAHGPQDGPIDCVQRVVIEALSCEDLPREGVRQRVADHLREQDPQIAEVETEALAELIAPTEVRGPTAQTTSLRVMNPAARYALVRRLLVRLSEERPVLLWLDNVEWGSDALSLVEYLLDDQRRVGCPVLVVLTANDERLAARAFEARQLNELSRLPGCRTCRLGTLAASDQAILIHRLLDLEHDLAQHVLSRSEGNPMFAIQLLADWVMRGALEATPRGFALRPGERAAIPDDLHSLWRNRLRELLRRGVEDAQERALQTAALLGTTVRYDEWGRVCHALGVEPPASVLDAMAAQGLAVLHGAGWSFASVMLRESLTRTAVEQGAAAGIHAHAAATLAQLYGPGNAQHADRVARHWLAAGRDREALGPLLLAVDALVRRADFDEAAALLEARDAALDRLHAPPTDPERLRGALLRGRASLKQGRVVEAARALDALRPYTSAAEPALYADALWLQAAIAWFRGELDIVHGSLERAMTLYESTHDPLGLARTCQIRAEVRKHRGELRDAIDDFRRAHDLYAELQDTANVGACLLGCAGVWRRMGDLDACAGLLDQACEVLTTAGDRAALAAAWGMQGDLARYRGDLDGAEREYMRALHLLQLVGSPDTGVQRINLGIVLLSRGTFRAALWMLEAGLEELTAAGQYGLVGAVHALLLPALAATRDWALWDLHYNEAQAAIDDTGLVDPDIAWAAEYAGDLAREAGTHARALYAWDLALRQYTALADHHSALRIRTSIEALPT